MIVKSEMSVAEFESDFYAEFGAPCDVVFAGEVVPNETLLSSIARRMPDVRWHKTVHAQDQARVGEIRKNADEEFGFHLVLYRVEIANDDVSLASLRTQDDSHATRDRNLKIAYSMTVGTFESYFLAAFGVYCDVLENGELADNNAQLAALQSEASYGAENASIDISANMLVDTVKKVVKDMTGLDIVLYQLTPANDNDTLASLRSQDGKSVAARAKSDSIEGTNVYLPADEDKFVCGDGRRRHCWHPIYHVNPVEELINIGENATIEFKASGRYNIRLKRKDPEIELAVARAVAGFLNAGGGTLLVGIDDSGQPVGLENDLNTLHKKRNLDGYELWLTTLLEKTLGLTATANVTIKFEHIERFDVARLNVHASSVPVFVKEPQNKVCFYVRLHNSTRPFATDAVVAYVEHHWGYKESR